MTTIGPAIAALRAGGRVRLPDWAQGCCLIMDGETVLVAWDRVATTVPYCAHVNDLLSDAWEILPSETVSDGADGVH